MFASSVKGKRFGEYREMKLDKSRSSYGKDLTAWIFSLTH